MSLSSLQTAVDILQVSFMGTEECSRCREVVNCREVAISRGGLFLLGGAGIINSAILSLQNM